MLNALFFRGILVAGIATTGQPAIWAQVDNAPVTDASARAVIMDIVKQRLKQFERDLGQAVKALWEPLAFPEDLAKIAALGSHATPALEELLRSGDPRTCRLAVRMMGDAIDKHLATLLSYLRSNGTNPGCRETAVLFLRDASESADVDPVLRNLAENDPEPYVRRSAQFTLDSRQRTRK